jgi:hypothetical protein
VLGGDNFADEPKQAFSGRQRAQTPELCETLEQFLSVNVMEVCRHVSVGRHELQKVVDGDRENSATGEGFCRHGMRRTKHRGGRSKRSPGEADANRDGFTPMFPSQ